jgi:hypothetical protein
VNGSLPELSNDYGNIGRTRRHKLGLVDVKFNGVIDRSIVNIRVYLDRSIVYGAHANELKRHRPGLPGVLLPDRSKRALL